MWVRLPTTPTVYLREGGTTRTLSRVGARFPSCSKRRSSTAEPAKSSSVAQAGWSTETTSSPIANELRMHLASDLGTDNFLPAAGDATKNEGVLHATLT